MPLRQLKAIYEKRKTVLEDIQRKDKKLDRSRKDQINGAIAEIDTLLKTIDTLREQEIEDNKKLEVKSLDINTGLLKNIGLVKKINERLKVKFEHSKTRQDLINLFIRKCETRTKYEFYSRLAKNDGYEHIAHVFQDFGEHEKEHAKIVFKYLNMTKTTPENIREAANIEQFYHNGIYPQFEDVARQENFIEIADFLKELAEIDSEHEKKFLKLLRIFHEKRIFSSEHVVKWKCRNCGHIVESKDAPKKCKVCKGSQGYFEVHVE